jgi:hypothetical protein
MDKKEYVRTQISKFDRAASMKQSKADLNAVYAVLESRGLSRSEISGLVKEVILENIHELKLKLQMELL